MSNEAVNVSPEQLAADKQFLKDHEAAGTERCIKRHSLRHAQPGKSALLQHRGRWGHRIGTCDECGSYIRTRFAGEGDNAPYSPEVEDVVMARLDAVAIDPSFAGGAAKRTGE